MKPKNLELYIIPAQPGFRRLEMWNDGATHDEPIIAWAIYPSFEEHAVEAITCDGMQLDNGLVRYGVLQPNGRVVVGGSETFLNIDEWYESARAFSNQTNK